MLNRDKANTEDMKRFSQDIELAEKSGLMTGDSKTDNDNNELENSGKLKDKKISNQSLYSYNICIFSFIYTLYY